MANMICGLSDSAKPSNSLQPDLPVSPGKPSCTARVLHLINGEHYSGAERVQDLLGMRLPEHGFDVGFACVKPDRFPKMRQCLSAPLYEMPMKSKVNLSAGKRIAKLVQREGYQIIHAHTPRTVMIGRLAARRAGVPLVYHVHSPTSRDSTRRLHDWLNQKIERWSLKGAAHLITVSHSLQRHMLEQGFSEDRITVVPNGVPTVESVLSRSCPSDTWTLGTVALFRPRKGTEVLLDAAALLKQKGVAVRVLAVGPFENAEYEVQLKKQVERLGLESAVEWTGFTQDVTS